MNYLNEYQTKKAEFFSQRQFKSSTFPTYDIWIKMIIQAYFADKENANSTTNEQVILDNTKQLSARSKNTYKNSRNNQQKKLSTKERLRKKLLEKKEKEMLKRL
jgi:hypothetical protein